MKTDARVRYTKMRIKEAFRHFLKEKPINKITVKEICDLAEINRATFYTHYADPYDLMEQIKAEALNDLKENLAKEEDGDFSGILTILDDPDLSSMILPSENADELFAESISTTYYDRYFDVIRNQLADIDEKEAEDVYEFIIGGCTNIIRNWIVSGRRISPEELSQKLNKLSSSFIRAYNS